MDNRGKRERSGYHVFCTDSGDYVLTTRRVFPSSEEAREYASGVSVSRKPVVISRTEIARAFLEARRYAKCLRCDREFRRIKAKVYCSANCTYAAYLERTRVKKRDYMRAYMKIRRRKERKQKAR